MDKAQTISWLRAKRGEWPAIAAAANVNYWWLQKFAQGVISNPTYDNFSKIVAYIQRTDPGAPSA